MTVQQFTFTPQNRQRFVAKSKSGRARLNQSALLIADSSRAGSFATE